MGIVLVRLRRLWHLHGLKSLYLTCLELLRPCSLRLSPLESHQILVKLIRLLNHSLGNDPIVQSLLSRDHQARGLLSHGELILNPTLEALHHLSLLSGHIGKASLMRLRLVIWPQIKGRNILNLHPLLAFFLLFLHLSHLVVPILALASRPVVLGAGSRPHDLTASILNGRFSLKGGAVVSRQGPGLFL